MIDSLPTRRKVLKSFGAGVAATSLLRPWPLLGQERLAERGDWDHGWDAEVLEGALSHLDKNFDPEAGLISGKVGPEYSYQSNLRSQTVHPTRTSMEYALYLFESKNADRMKTALRILDRMEELQEKDQGNRWFGLWSWYVEEPLAKMPAVDFNWADFNGALLLSMIFRHHSRLSSQTIEKMRRMIGRCCTSIQRRNVTMGYTNIACMGTFVTLAGAELLEDADLHAYALDRLNRLAAYIDRTGSFEEYNSPTYTRVVVQNMTRMLMFVKDRKALAIAQRIHERAWLHIAKHWHLPTRQIAPPMSRCYSNDLGPQIWIQKALNNAVPFLDKGTIRANVSGEGGDVSYLEYQCPDNLRAYFTAVGPSRLHREIFLLGAPADTAHANASVDVSGTTYLTPAFCIGSANRSDFWNQRRPLMAYWGLPQHPVRCMQMKVMKDDYDFSSALFYSVQNNGAVLGQVCFRSDGGDRHISLDPIHDQRFQLSRMVVQLSFDVWEESWKLFSEDVDVTASIEPLPLAAPLFVDMGDVQVAARFLDPVFSSYEPQMRFVKSAGKAAIELTLISSKEPVTIDWRKVTSAGCGIALMMKKSKRKDMVLSGALQSLQFSMEKSAEASISRWQSPEGKLEVVVSREVGLGDSMNRTFRSSIDGHPAPVARLSDVPLAD
jgi:hypothetical protein